MVYRNFPHENWGWAAPDVEATGPNVSRYGDDHRGPNAVNAIDFGHGRPVQMEKDSCDSRDELKQHDRTTQKSIRVGER